MRSAEVGVGYTPSKMNYRNSYETFQGSLIEVNTKYSMKYYSVRSN